MTNLQDNRGAYAIYEGMILYNSNTNCLEQYIGGAWMPLSQDNNNSPLLDWFNKLDHLEQLAHREAFCKNNLDQWLKYLKYEFRQQ